jgi:hypothetical protein
MNFPDVFSQVAPFGCDSSESKGRVNPKFASITAARIAGSPLLKRILTRPIPMRK